jgi:hypothetical protein
VLIIVGEQSQGDVQKDLICIDKKHRNGLFHSRAPYIQQSRADTTACPAAKNRDGALQAPCFYIGSASLRRAFIPDTKAVCGCARYRDDCIY